ncbi:hypothetical protein M0Q28_06465 [Patescibacteria group bacterium]|jgi:hypothetical protein|nr:hypothetical protein [Patescibacteria group bacterium]
MNGEQMYGMVLVCRAYYQIPGNSTGGSLHIVLDDGNIETEHVVFCSAEAIKEADIVGEGIAHMLLQMSYDERSELRNHYAEYAME